MPARSRTGRVSARRAMRGKGFWDFAKKANTWLRKTKLISKVGAPLAGLIPGPYGTAAKTAVGWAKIAGYGRPAHRMVSYRGGRRVGRPCKPCPRKGRGVNLGGGYYGGCAGGCAGKGINLAGYPARRGGARKKKRSMSTKVPLPIAY